jgi:hypothetical protein
MMSLLVRDSPDSDNGGDEQPEKEQYDAIKTDDENDEVESAIDEDEVEM